MKTIPYSLRNLFVILTLVVTASFMTDRALGDEIPTFSDADVNTLVKTYAQFVDDYVEACKAVKAGDNSKIEALQAKAPQLQAQAAQIAGKVKPDEAAKFQAFVATCSQKVVDAMK